MNMSSLIGPERKANNAKAGLFLVLGLTAALLPAGAAFAADGSGASDSGQAAPRSLDLSKVKIKIVDVTFVKELTGVNATYRGANPDKYRAAIVTLEVKKPAGETLSIQAQDLSLHYTYGSTADVARCSGLSAFSASKDVDRPMSLWSAGYGSIDTGISTMKGDTVYIDAFFDGIEPDVSMLYLLVAQPIGVTFPTKGWQ